MKNQTAVVAGAGPAGLTAAVQLIRETSVDPLVFEMQDDVGGIARTVQYDNYRMDLGGHRFFSKSDWVMNWWQEFLPIEETSEPVEISYQNSSRLIQGRSPSKANSTDEVMQVRRRLSRIYYQGRFFDYPIKLNWNTLRNLGLRRAARIGTSYFRSKLVSVRPENSLEDFLVNRFGRELYLTFFKEYTEKVWGIPCRKISADWGAQRIKGLSITGAVWHALRQVARRGEKGISQRNTRTSLIERFLYPKFGPGQMWRCVARYVCSAGGELHLCQRVERLYLSGGRIEAVQVRDLTKDRVKTIPCDYFFSTMPVRDLISAMEPAAPPEVIRVAQGLQYRDFIVVGVAVPSLGRLPHTVPPKHMIADNWIYVQDRGVRLGRIQIFNNWSPSLIENSEGISLGLEYFCSEGDDLWSMRDKELIEFALNELQSIGFIESDELLASQVVRVKKAYPGYFGTYPEFNTIRNFTDGIENLFLIGRNGMHRYNNQDHSMLTAKLAVQAIRKGDPSKDALWQVNIDDDYHEELHKKS